MHGSATYEALQRRPSDETLRAVRDLVAPEVEVASVRRLRGSMWCGMHVIGLLPASQTALKVVLRRFPASTLECDGDVHRREWDALRALEGRDVPVPKPLAFDPDGSILGVPAIVMSWLPGQPLAPLLASMPRTETGWVEPVARALASVHRQARPIARLPGVDVAMMGEQLLSPGSPDLDERLAHFSRGRDMLRVLRRDWPPPTASVFLHGDFHPSNVLWRRDSVTGIVDWSEARSGPREFDLAHIRFEIALRFDLSGLDRFQHAYEHEAGIGVPCMPLWDLMQIWQYALATPSWVWFFEQEGRTDGTPETIEARRDAFARWALERVRQ